MKIKCYACDRIAIRQCPECRAVYCSQHGGDRCARCGGVPTALPRGIPVSPLASPWLFRGVVVAVVVGVLLGWGPDAYDRLARRPATDGGPSAASLPTPAPTATAVPTVAATSVPILTPTPAAVSTSTATAVPPATPTPAAAGPVMHRVGAGETLLDIGNQYGVTVEAITALNALPNPDQLQQGQEITIPGPGAVAPQPAAPTAAPEPRYVIHRVGPGESLQAIADRYGTTVATLIAYNGLSDPELLQEGQEIAIPQ